MRKKLLLLLLSLVLFCSAGQPAFAAEQTAYAAGKKAQVSQMEILLDGEKVNPSGYLITTQGTSAYTFFKLRDLAYLMKDKECKFNITYNAKTKTIVAATGTAYVGDGTELQPVGSGTQVAQETSAKVTVDGKTVGMEAYNIKGFTYFKLRDVGEAFGFTVDYRNASKQGIMKTPGYVEPDPEPTPTPNPDPEPTPDPEPEPTKSHIDGKLTVLIDVGHGGSDGGSAGTAPSDFVNYKGKTIKKGASIQEKDFNLPVALYLRDMLKAKGATVIMSAELDQYVSFSDRKALIESNANTADLCFSVHHNAFNGNAAGFEVLAQVQYENGGAGKELAAQLDKAYQANGRTRHRPTVFRRGQNGDYYAILRYAANVDMLAVISEYAFIDHQQDVTCVLSDDGLKQEAQAMCDAIMAYFSTHEY